ncbi:substrate-binding domain-containing protein [Deinococcus radiodurans]|jgi:transcriptional regulator, LacI family|uniref:Transcriptional regulator, sugar-binding, putative n=1 Tax=Deinococcus radiodurans (strain ATCC 13939 / DSM 20539 / JCM 16871 / CCUG 27074 / LMG 4051 / NBRC 15346 / NCIMB 9279 / VKM B-1422 / R1) TaxID=243230 RepID=Q9RRI9_DEIRA|nr:substrate-binding domain-containing protein [Deinococcus radiodurans]AAF12042.1 transcriptional regulator, sugar-binding, putative [Deinococcus radiodurans R1 = ATCC 13939 = DSM 20539]ANC70466.1 transcriptional regulator [Deinococcus radiodurans R1 = ATCC 13939 = DSM 20539]QEM71865.1 LacI family DNA-binding transcriptional regulator [Deinococcus radiodurans]QIP28149.1 substrate-binding domain-containing protein [Deinococcus radiodurans]QIP30974.1 substrate-binding domain-containing protein 
MSAAKAAPGSARPRATLRDVARAVGVSVATVSNAYNRPDQLSAGLRDKVLAAARDLGYQGPDPLARSLRRGKTGVIGVVYDAPLEYAFADPAAALFLGSLSRSLRAEGLNLLLLSASQDPAPVRSASVDGLILYCASEGSDLLAAVLERGLPTVLVDQQPQPGAVGVGIDDAGGARAAAAHLVALGHRDIGVLCLELGPEPLGGPVSPKREAQAAYHTTAERLRGYRAGADAARLWPYECSQNTPADGEAQARALLTAQPEVTALLCMSDVLAQGAYQAAQTLGRRVPEDLSLIGYDDVPLSAALNLSTVWQPTAEKGRRVGEALLAQLSGEVLDPEVLNPSPLPTRLVVRGSTAERQG